MFGKSILEMVGDEHRRNRALVQPAFSPKRSQWWIDRWIGSLVDEAVSAFEGRGHAELNAELCARIPLQTITSSFGLTREEALDFREGAGEGGMTADMDERMARFERTTAMLERVIEDRRAHPQDDVITMLVESELEEDGERHLLTDDEIYGFARLILTAGSGTTWRQLGILLVALLHDPALLDAVREDRELLRRAGRRSRPVGAHRPDLPPARHGRRRPVRGRRSPRARSSRWCWARPTAIPSAGTIPSGSIRTATRSRTSASPAARTCASACTSPRAEMMVAMNAVLDRLPNVRLDPDAPPARIIGLEHRGPNGIPVVFG